MQQQAVKYPPQQRCAQKPTETTYTSYINTSRGQFLALLASSVPRCGCNSPARLLVSNSPLVLSMWRSFVAAPDASLCLVVATDPPSNGDDNVRVSVCFGVSRFTLGVTQEPRAVHVGEDYAHWLGPGVYLLHRVLRRTFSRELLLVHPDRHEESVCVLGEQYRCAYAANGRWLIVREIPFFNGEQTLSITAIPQEFQNPEKPPEARETPVVVTCYRNAFPGIYDVVVDKEHPDEALAWGAYAGEAHFALIDVAQTHETNDLVVLNSTRCSFPTRNLYQEAIILRRLSGEVVYVVNVHVLSQEFQRVLLLLLVETSTGGATQLATECNNLSQVSSSLFCVCCRNEYQLWDCHNTAHPLRSVCITGGGGDSGIQQVVGGSGFLFVLAGGNKVTVIEALTGTPLLTFVVTCAVDQINRLASLL